MSHSYCVDDKFDFCPQNLTLSIADWLTYRRYGGGKVKQTGEKESPEWTDIKYIWNGHSSDQIQMKFRRENAEKETLTGRR